MSKEYEISPWHPKQTLAFYVPNEFAPVSKDQLSRLIDLLAASRDWLCGPPEVFELTEEREDRDEPMLIIGGALEIYSALPPNVLPIEIDERHFEEVSATVAAVAELSRKTGATFEFELDGETIGFIEGGKIDRSLQIGLLDEWQRTIAEQRISQKKI